MTAAMLNDRGGSSMDSEIDRRLTNILSADVFGYSRLMGLDEAGTLALLNDYKGVMTGVIAQHRGRVVSAAGDSLLAEFSSPVMAVQSAVEVQRRLAERNQSLEPDRQMWFRIGINLGDVIVEGADIYGDDVNIAARLQSMSEPGGILISGTVFDQVKQKLSLGFEPLGPQRLKNIEAEVPVNRTLQQSVGEKPKEPGNATEAEKWHRVKTNGIRLGAIALLCILINAFTWDGDAWAQWPVLGVAFLFVLQSTGIFRR
jgi:class 3 adenylate cyclase